MHIIIDKEKQNGDFYLNFIEAESNEADKEDFKKAVATHGKIVVDFGGTFTKEVSEDVTDPDTGAVTTTTKTVTLFKFNENLREIPANLPYIRVFKKSQYGEDAENFATLYANEMDTVIQTALQKLKDEVDSFSTPDIDIHY